MKIIEILNKDIIDKDEIFELIPELKSLEISPVNHPAHKYNIWEHSIESVKLVENPILKITLLLHDIGKPEATTIDKHGFTRFFGHQAKSVKLSKPILKRLGLNKGTIDLILVLIKYHDTPMDSFQKRKDFVDKYGVSILCLLFEIQIADMLTHSDDYAVKKIVKLNEFIDLYKKEFHIEQKIFKIK